MINFALSNTGDTLVNEVAFTTAFPATSPPYVAKVAWYRSDTPVQFGGRMYARNHPPQIARAEWLKFAGHYRGIPVFKAAEEEVPSVIYLPVRPGCVFQPLAGLVGRDKP